MRVPSLLILLPGPLIAVAQSPDPDWVFSYQPNSANNYWFTDMVTDGAGNTYVLGRTDATAGGLVFQVTPSGTLGWVDELGPGAGSKGRVKVDDDGNVYIATQVVQSFGDGQCFARKYDPNGTVLWSDTLNGPAADNDHYQDMVIDSAHNVFVTGTIWTHPFPYVQQDIITVKYDDTGAREWVTYYDHSNEDVGMGIDVDGLGNCYVTGKSPDDSLGSGITLKYGPTGELLWERRIPGALSYGGFLRCTPDQHLVVVGSKNDELVCVEYDYEGGESWTLQADTVHWPNDVEVDSAGYLYVTGWKMGAIQFYTLKVDPDGNIAWLREEGASPNDDQGHALAVDALGNVYVAAESHDDVTFESGISTMGLDQQGAILWSDGFQQSLGDHYRPVGIELDGAGSVYVGSEVFADGLGRIEVMKYAKPVEVPVLPGLVPIQLYPDPTDGVVQLAGLTDMQCAFRILDIAGRSVLEGRMHSGAVEVGSLRTGIYILRLMANGRELRLPFVRE